MFLLLTALISWILSNLVDGLVSGTDPTSVVPVSTDLHAFCQSEYFRVKCGQFEVIVITHARYGRMHISRCVREDFGYVGCSSDVRDTMDLHCSGRRACSVRVLDDNFDNVRPCHDDLKSYLEVEYDCVKVLASDRHSCLTDSSPSSSSRGSGLPVNALPSAIMPLVYSSSGVTNPWWSEHHLSTTLMSGYLAGVWAADTGCGTTDAPWVVKVGLGQRINVTVLDFSVQRTLLDHPEALPSGSRSRSQLNNFTIVTPRPPMSGFAIGRQLVVNSRQHQSSCKAVYAVIKDTGGGTTLTVCSGTTRRTIYESRGNAIEIKVVGSKTALNSAGLLVRFEAVGCPNLEAPPGVWVKRKNDDVINIGCQATSDALELRCHGNTWFGNHSSGINCTQRRQVKPAEMHSDTVTGRSRATGQDNNSNNSRSTVVKIFHRLSIGSAFAIISILALLVGLLILTAGVVLLNRLNRTTVELVGHDLPTAAMASSLSEPRLCPTTSDLTTNWSNTLPTACSPLSTDGCVRCSCTVSAYSDEVDVCRHDNSVERSCFCRNGVRTAISSCDWSTEGAAIVQSRNYTPRCITMSSLISSGISRCSELESTSSLFVVGN